MYREEFILKLRKELSKLPPEEIVEATEYFEEIFAEATEGLGEEERLAEEKRLVEEFGNPKKIAAQVKADYAARLLDGDESVIDGKPGAKKKLSAVWWVIIGICSAPVSIPIAIGIICLIIGIACGIIEIYAAIVACGVAAIAAVVLGFVFLTSSAASGIMTIGIGIALLALTAAAAVGAYIGTKAMIRAIARKIRQANEKRKHNKLAKDAGDADEWVLATEGAAVQETDAGLLIEDTERGSEDEQIS